jgi:hypothetical protein
LAFVNIIAGRHFITSRGHLVNALLTAILLAVVPAANDNPGDLVKAATARVGFSPEGHPVLPSLSTEVRGRVCNEIATSALVRGAYEKLDVAKRRNVDWFEGVAELEKQRAVWCLQSCLCHPSPDVQIHALRSLERLRDKNAVAFLVLYAEYMAVPVAGSENATIHGVLHASLAKTLSALTGVEVTLKGQDEEGLKKGIKRWRKWLVLQDETPLEHPKQPILRLQSSQRLQAFRKGQPLIFEGLATVPIHRPAPEHFKIARVSDAQAVPRLVAYDRDKVERNLRGMPVRAASPDYYVYNSLFKGTRLFLYNGTFHDKDPKGQAGILGLYGCPKLEAGVRYRLTWACWPVGASKAVEVTCEFELKEAASVPNKPSDQKDAPPRETNDAAVTPNSYADCIAGLETARLRR